MKPYLFEGFDPSLRDQLGPDAILVTGPNFGIGSSREHVPQAMKAWGVPGGRRPELRPHLPAQLRQPRACSSSRRPTPRGGAGRLARSASTPTQATIDVDGRTFVRRPSRRSSRSSRPAGGLVPWHAGRVGAMIVRDLGDAWQIVLQTDHADLSAAFARAWATPLAPSLVLATERHDDGWAVWEQSPARRRGRHAGQLPRRRRPLPPRLLPRRDRRDHRGGRVRRTARLDARRRDLPAALRPRHRARADARGGGAGRRGRIRRGAGGEVRRRARRAARRTTRSSSSSTGSRSTSACATWSAARRRSSRATGSSRSGPWRVALAPYPFGSSPADFSLLRRVVPKDGSVDVLAAAPQETAITIE